MSEYWDQKVAALFAELEDGLAALVARAAARPPQDEVRLAAEREPDETLSAVALVVLDGGHA